MSLRKNNLGEEKEITWGVLGKRQKYVNQGFQAVQEEKEKDRFDWRAKLEPWSSADRLKYAISVGLRDTGTTTTTTTTPPVAIEWQNATTEWQNETDTWNNI